MPTVHCPGCKRALNLPEGADVGSAVCPLCRTEFPVAAQAPVPTLPMPQAVPPVPRFTVRQTGQEGPDERPLPARPTAEFDEDHPPPVPLEPAVDSASLWMKLAGTTGLIHLLFCACVTMALTSGGRTFVAVFVASYVLQFIFSLMFFSAPGELRRSPLSTGFVWTLGVAAVLQGTFTFVTSVPLFVFTADRISTSFSESDVSLLGPCLANLAVIVTSLVGGAKTILVARRAGALHDSTGGRPDA